MKARLICSFLCSVLAVGGCPKEVAESNYDGTWRVTDTANAISFCVTIDGNDLVNQNDCSGDSNPFFAGGSVQITGTGVVLQWSNSGFADLPRFNYVIVADADGSSLAGTITTRTSDGFAIEGEVVLTRE